MKILEFILASTLNFAWRRRRIWSNSTSLGVIFPCGGGVLVAISCIFERRRARFSYFHKSDDDGLKIRKPGMPGFLGISPRQTTKAHVLYVPGVNLQLITQERDHKDPSQITAPHMTFGRTVCKTAVIFCQVNALFIAQQSCHVDSACAHASIPHASRQRQRGSSIQPTTVYCCTRVGGAGDSLSSQAGPSARSPALSPSSPQPFSPPVP
jgi:hypothetical protein